MIRQEIKDFYKNRMPFRLRGLMVKACVFNYALAYPRHEYNDDELYYVYNRKWYNEQDLLRIIRLKACI